MKKKIFLMAIFFLAIFTLTGCGMQSTSIEEINLDTLKEKIENKDSFILEITQTGCSHCAEFSPRLQSILSDHQITGFSLNIADLTEEEQEEFNDIIEVRGTPTTVFFVDGEEDTTHRLVGAVSNSEVESRLKDTGYID